MREFVIGAELAAVIAMLIVAGAAYLNAWRGREAVKRKTAKKGNSGQNTPISEKEAIDRLTERSVMQNFYLYDGSEQRDPREMARDAYENRGGK